MSVGWYFSNDMSPSDELVDKFADSKFGIDRWGSFAREIIQNSLDAQDNEEEPVEVIFDLNKGLSLADIPGGNRTKEILEKCMKAATNKQTKSSYKVGLEVLGKEKVYCMKISDKNTKGVRTGREEAWGAFVFDEGRSVKQRPGSAGSHGVGKKVPFIISSCNTVFYATKNKYLLNGEEQSDCLLQGKTTLISWTDDDGCRKNSKGWYGVINDTVDPKNKVSPIEKKDFDAINPYFLREEEYGTDVIIIGVNIYDKEEEVKSQIISAVLDNFFVAILRGRLEVTVFSEIINAERFDEVFIKYYKAQSEAKNTLAGCLEVFRGEVGLSEEIYDQNCDYLGRIDVYFSLGNEHNKKYYTVVRNHGMRITDYRLNKAGQPYTAVVYVDGVELNKLLSSLENAAHDNFVTVDENMEIDSNAVDALNRIRDVVSRYIYEKTSIDDQEGQTIEGLSNIITIPGLISTISRKTTQPVLKKHNLSQKGKGSVKVGHNEGEIEHIHTGGKKKIGEKKPIKKGGDLDCILYENFILEPFFMKGNKEYVLRFAVEENIEKADILIKSINSDGKEDDTVTDFIESAYTDGIRRKVENGRICNVLLKEDEVHSVVVKMKRDVTYQLSAEIYAKGVK